MKTHGISGFLLTLLFCSSLYAENLRDPHFVARAESGFEHIFNMDYDKAAQAFISLEKDFPQHPAPPLYLASIPWLKEMERRQDLNLDRFLAPTYFNDKTNQVMPSRERSEFLKRIQQAEALAKAVLQRDRRDKDGRYFLATVYGLRASFAITIDHSLREAFSYGNKSYSYSKQLVQEDPKYYDAYLILGIYEYTIGLIPWYMRWAIFVLGGRGSKEEGLAHLRVATEKGQYVKDQAVLASMVLDARERLYPEGLALARDLSARFPRSYLFPINLAQILQLTGRKRGSNPIASASGKASGCGGAELRQAPYRNIPLQSGHQVYAHEQAGPGQGALCKNDQRSANNAGGKGTIPFASWTDSGMARAAHRSHRGMPDSPLAR